MEIVLEAKKLNKTFLDGARIVKALDNVSLELEKGQILGIVGESGSGKSTLLKALAGLITVDEGEIIIGRKDLANSSPAVMGQFLQMIFQDAITSFDPRMRIEESIMEAAAPSVTKEQLGEIILKLGLDTNLLDKKPGQLSGGQCQRMSIARALVSGADILLCDEITSALDVVTQAQIVEIIGHMKELSKLSIIFVSHDIALVSTICDKIAVMHEGKLIEHGTVEDIMHNPREAYTKNLITSARMQSL